MTIVVAEDEFVGLEADDEEEPPWAHRSQQAIHHRICAECPVLLRCP